MTQLSVKEVCKTYSSNKVVDELSFQISKKQILALLGPNGSGKSTTMQIILGLKKANSGSVQITKNLGYAAQDLSFPASLKTHEILKFVQSHYQSDYREDLENLKVRFDLGEFWNQETGGLSGGQKRRLAVACAFANKPDLVILDEPTTGLDLESKIKLWSELIRFKENGGAILLCSHDLLEVQKVADQVILLQKGKSLFQGSIAEILSSIDLKQVSFKSSVSPDRIQNLKHCLSFKKINSNFEIITENSDALVKEIILADVDFEELNIVHASLEQAFMRLQQEAK